MSLLNKTAIHVASLALLALCTPLACGAAALPSEATVQPAAPASTGTSVAATPTPARKVLQTATNAPVARSTSVQETIAYAAPRTGVPVTVIPAQEMDAETFGRIVADLSVMSRIIEKSIRDAPAFHDQMMMRQLQDIYGPSYADVLGHVSSVGPRILRPSNERPIPMYLGGYGAVFSLRVDFPLVPPPEMPSQDQAAEHPDQVWAQAQRELLDPQAAAGAQRSVPAAEPYKQELVDGLKDALTAALKHATNIRDLEPEAWLTILVQGPAPTAQDRQEDTAYAEPSPLAGPPAAARTLLTLRARKTDIDQYAKGQLDAAQFQQRVQTVTY